MAEIRKHNPAQGNAIAEALKAAMGEPVRPATPGAQPAVAPAADPPPAARPSWVSFTVTKE